ncbi:MULTISPECIES: cysteine desulfurase [unclassified Polaromonas]|uniref:cysteine desulfurase n=1 Tax=unclassified Polaromonas TaxID=2638319 RepID=UPI0018CAAF47|nr:MULTISPECIES: cysteine desulfurase [unclassified Polaromonas]MBG6073651.1 cysteine desulfurase/selenocysteine lyase [Polaromonas sp. CG_9.7]MBG6078047.1 cysteine desulfurase/selenocysteine lyase [Polaromonas sp. CG_9.11]MBG6115653.1 cysteine desulfurase/selenocysteine lyase [Polaromonas sp. CG_9.2]MDH6186597.1 cysteine desulfurase/selenocysteine lyase [Polaromonas sp. CG_23.6]
MNARAEPIHVTPAFDVERVRADFPILQIEVEGKPLVYLDNAASSQMPQPVIDRLVRYQSTEHANIHRAVHTLSERATAAYEEARAKLQRFINAPDVREVIFTSGTTEAINLVMHGYGRKFIQAGDEIILTTLEHHSNIVPWQMLAEETGAIIRVLPINDAGELCLDQFEPLFNDRTKLVGVSHVSNALGSINPVKQMIALAHKRGVPVLVDGAQAAPHLPVDVQDLDCDFYAFSGHKLCGPTGIGVLYGKAALLEKMQPFKGGGDMILSVSFEKTVYNAIPYKFEAGTPPIAAAIGLGAAVDYLSAIGMDVIAAHEHALLQYATSQFSDLPGLRLIGTAQDKAAVLSFTLDGIHPHDVGTLLNQDGIAVRTGHHCAQPVMARFKVPATTRASFAFYNTMAEVDALVAGIRSVQKVFA